MYTRTDFVAGGTVAYLGLYASSFGVMIDQWSEGRRSSIPGSLASDCGWVLSGTTSGAPSRNPLWQPVAT
ncbi:MAG TPA: hypothetical protein V6C81_06090 [Planktothrix sp.]